MTVAPDVRLLALRRFLLTGVGVVNEIAGELSRRFGHRAGVGISVFSAGQQLACRVSLGPPDAVAMARLVMLVRSELPVVQGNPVVLLSQLDSPRIVSIDEYRVTGIRIGNETVAIVRHSHVALILAHIPCFMSWNSNQLGEALVRKHGGVRPIELYVFQTETLWLADPGFSVPCLGGLRQRRERLATCLGIRHEMTRVADYLRGQLSPTVSIDYAYDPWRDRAVHVDSLARKAIALGALVSAARILGDLSTVERGLDALSQLAAHRASAPIGDIHDAHLLLSSTDAAGPTIEKVRGTLRRSGALIAPGPGDQEYFPGVALAALASRHALSDAEYRRSMEHYRHLFRTRPTWPTLWWQLRAWSAIALLAPDIASDFVFELADWAMTHQLPSGAFNTWSWPVAPSFQTVCVVEGMLGAVQTARQTGNRSCARRYLSASRRGLQFSSSLVLDARHADLLPCPSRAIGGVRTWHGELILRADAAGHYLAALTGLLHLIESD
jgi:hypothetical protein